MKSKGRFQKVFPTQLLYGDPVLLFLLRLLRKSRWPWKSISIKAITYFFSKRARFYGRYVTYLQAAKRILEFQAIQASKSWFKKCPPDEKNQVSLQNNNNRWASSSFPSTSLYYIARWKTTTKLSIKRGWVGGGGALSWLKGPTSSWSFSAGFYLVIIK